jgi:hypothetical protein
MKMKILWFKENIKEFGKIYMNPVIETDKVEDFEYVYGQVQENYLKIMSWLVCRI